MIGRFFESLVAGFLTGVTVVLAYELITNGWAEYQGNCQDQPAASPT